MTISTFDVDDVCPEATLLAALGNDADLLASLVPTRLNGDTTTIRQTVLDDVLRALRRRRPSIISSDITDPTELGQAVAYGTISSFYQSAMTGKDDIHHVQFRIWSDRYAAEIDGMNLTLDGGVDAATFSIAVSRR